MEEIKSVSMDPSDDGNMDPMESQAEVAIKGDSRRYLIPSYLVDDGTVQKERRVMKNKVCASRCCPIMKLAYGTFIAIALVSILLVGMALSALLVSGTTFGSTCFLKYAKVIN